MEYTSKVETSMQARLAAAGIEFIKVPYARKNDSDGFNYFLEYDGKRLPAPWVNKCPAFVKKHYGITI